MRDLGRIVDITDVGIVDTPPIPPVKLGQGDYVRYWPDSNEPGPLAPGTCDRQSERAESSCLGTWFVAGCFVGASFLAFLYSWFR